LKMSDAIKPTNVLTLPQIFKNSRAWRSCFV